MKKYVKHKDFIPIDFIEKRNINIKRANNKAISLLLIINIIMFPLNIKVLLLNEDKIEVDLDIPYEGIEVNNIEKWIELECDYIKSFRVRNNIGEIILEDYNGIDYIEKLGFKVRKYNIEEENFKIEVVHD